MMPSPASGDCVAWLQATKDRCPVWSHSWDRALARLIDQGSCRYRRYRLESLVDGVSVAPIQSDNTSAQGIRVSSLQSKRGQKAIFGACHQDMVQSINGAVSAALAGKHDLSGQLTNTLVSEWADPAWPTAVKRQISMLVSDAPRSRHGSTGARYYPRLLAVRRLALVLKKDADQGGGWVTLRGALLSTVLKNSSQPRRQALETLTSLPGLETIELPRDMDFQSLSVATMSVQKALTGDHPLAVKARNQSRPWRLAIRRIRGLGLDGCFDAATQTIIVDPRHLDSLRHELCHWLLGHSVSAADTRKHHVSEVEVHDLEAALFV